MSAYLFKQTGAMAANDYLLGHYRWPQVMRIAAATLECQPGSETVVVELWIGGAATGHKFFIPPSDLPYYRHTLTLGLDVPEDTEIRMRVIAAPTGHGVTGLGVTLNAASAELFTVPDPEMFVLWVNGAERLRLFDYNPLTRVFSENSPGISTGRATFTNAGDNTFTISIQAAIAAVVDATRTLDASLALVENMGASEEPRVEFWWGDARLACISKSGVVRAPWFTESAPVAAAGRFQFYGNGSLAATIGSEGITAAALKDHAP